MGKRESKVKDLVEKLRKGEITSDEARREIRKRGLGHEETWKDFIGYVVWGILCFLPAIARGTGLGILSFFAQLPAIEFPAIVVYLSIILFIVMIPLTAWGMYFNSRRGGCRSEDHTVILLKSGPYAIVRHPSVVAWAIFFATAPIILSGVVPFTILSVVAIVGIVAYHYYGCVVEERELDMPKWGEEYRQYMKEVPRFNFIKGLWNLRKRT
jgi:protein-S-isoprenylcysteine O-methyltransferase Ste14